MSEEKEIVKKNHTYKSSAESIARKLLKKVILLAAASLVFTFFCLFSHAGIDELSDKYINFFSAFILFVVFIIGLMFYNVFSFMAYRLHKKNIISRGTVVSGKILKSQQTRRHRMLLYIFTVKLESGEYFVSEPYNEDYFEDGGCKECTVYSHNGENIIGEFIEIVIPKNEEKEKKQDEKK